MFVTEDCITRSDDGFSIVFVFRYVIYVDKCGRLMKVDLDVQPDPPRRAMLFVREINEWTQPNLAKDEKMKILQNIREAIEARGFRVQIEVEP